MTAGERGDTMKSIAVAAALGLTAAPPAFGEERYAAVVTMKDTGGHVQPAKEVR
jgi:hypothetical protein